MGEKYTMQTIRQFPSWFSKQKLSGKVAIGFAGLFMLCCLCSFPMAILSPSKPASEVALTDVDISSIQTAAVDTAVAVINQTATANIPTSTSSPIPTFTSEATLPPQPTQDSYEILIGEKVSDYANALFEVNEYVQQAGNDPSLILDGDWKTKAGFALGILNFRAEEMAKLEPSPNYVNLHAIIIKLAEETYLFTDSYANGIDNLDSAMIEKATQHLINMTTFMQEATTEIGRIKATP